MSGPSGPLPGSGAPARDRRAVAADAGRLTRLALVFYGAVFAVAFAWRTLVHGESLLYASPAAVAQGARPLRNLAIGLAAGLLLVAVSRVWSRRTEAGAALTRALTELLGRLRPGAIVILALTSGIAEEAFFRGALQPRVGLLWATLLFGLAHFAPRRELLAWAPASLLAGLALGALFDWTGNLIAPATAHVTVNALNLHWMTREPANPGGAAPR